MSKIISIDLLGARKRLCKLWFIYSGIIFFIFFFLAMYTTRFENIKKDAWEWFLPHIVPTLTLISGVFFADLVDSLQPQRKVNSYFFQTAFWISAAYLTTFSLIILNAVPKEDNILEHYQDQTIYLFPFQTITSTAIGIFFSKTGSHSGKKE